MIGMLQALRRAVESRPRAQKALLGCGVGAAVWWVAMDIVGSLRYPGYSYTDQTISELSAEGAPTRTFMLTASSMPYFVLLIAFGIGVWAAAGQTRAGRVTGAVLIGEALFGTLGGLLFPMATREVMAAGEDTLRNQLHAPYGMGMPILFTLAIGFGSRLLGARFRRYSYGTLVIMLVFGVLMGLQNGRLAANESTPWMGIEERIIAYAPMLWFVVLSLGLLRARGAISPADPTTSTVLPRRMPRVA